MSNVFASKLTLSSHAKERLRQRHSIESIKVGVEWVANCINKAEKKFHRGHKIHYVVGENEFVMDGNKIVTIKPSESGNKYITQIGGLVAKEVQKLLTNHKRNLRKADINVAELTLNYLKARNPKVKESIQEKLTDAIDEKERILSEIRSVELSAEHYGVDV